MRVIAVTAVAVLLPWTVASCSGADATEDSPAPSVRSESTAEPTSATDAEVPLLERQWANPLVVGPLWSDPDGPPPRPTNIALTARHLLATGSFDNSPGTTNPTPNVQLDYGVLDVEDGQVRVMRPLPGHPSTVTAIPGTDLFVAYNDTTIGVLDPARRRFLWTRETRDPGITDLTADRIWTGRVTPNGREVCFTVDSGDLVHDRACRQAALTTPNVVDGVTWWPNAEMIDLPEGGHLSVPRTDVSDAETSERLWSYGGADVSIDGDGLAYATSTFAASDLGLVRVDYVRAAETPDPNGAQTRPDAVLRLVEARTGEVVRTLGRVQGGELLGFAGAVAVFLHQDGSSSSAAGYQVA